jgi:hypothetical protein
MYTIQTILAWIFLAVPTTQEPTSTEMVVVSAGTLADRQQLVNATQLEFRTQVDASNGMTRFVSDDDLEQLRYANTRLVTTLIVRDGLISNDAIRWLNTPLYGFGLERLDLSGSSVDCGVAWHIARMPGIQSVKLSRTDVGDDGLFVLQKCNAKELFLDETLITKKGVCAIPLYQQYERLSLAKTIVDDNAAFHLAKISRLEHLDLSHTQITERGMMSLLLEQKSLVSLRIVGCTISGKAITEARQLHPDVRVVFNDNEEPAGR